MLETLCKKDKQWRQTAFNICKDKQQADDLVNEMYLKLHNSTKTNITDFYVYMTMRSIYLDNIRKSNRQKETYIDDIFNLESYIKENKCSLEDRQLINEALNELNYVDREVLLHTSERSLRKNQEYLGIHVQTLYYIKKKALERLKQTNTVKQWANQKEVKINQKD